MKLAVVGSLVAAGAVLIPIAIGAEAPPRSEMTVIHAAAHAVSRPLRDVVPFSPGLPAPAAAVVPLRKPNKPGGGHGGGGGGAWTDPDLQTPLSVILPVSLGIDRDGIAANGSIPPDTNLAAGDTQVVEIANTEYAVYTKDGTLALGPAAIHTVFADLGGTCASSDGGDPIVLYDQLAGRWLISQLEYNNSFTSNLVCLAVSKTSDATGAYNLYAFNFGSKLPDYPKFGVWPDAYYFSANIFNRGISFAGAQACAFDRSALLSGATTVTALCTSPSTTLYNLLPADLDGSSPPAAGEPGFFVQFVSNALNVYRLHADFVATNNSTFTAAASLPVGAFREACGGGACVPQLGSTTQLDTLADRLMYRLSYRNFGTRESLLVNHAVQVSSASSQTGVRWYEIGDPNGTPTIVQEGTYSPDATTYRWMGSIAQDKLGNMLLGYSTSSQTSYPGIAYAGRVVGDTAGTMRLEVPGFAGAGSQTTYSRWGDYASLAIDPSDDCTFWFATEYLPSTGVFNWHTRIQSLKFATCGP